MRTDSKYRVKEQSIKLGEDSIGFNIGMVIFIGVDAFTQVCVTIFHLFWNNIKINIHIYYR